MEYAIRIGLKATNNETEYEAFLVILWFVTKFKVESLNAFCDSQLVVNQVQGDYLAKDHRMIAYLNEVKNISMKIRDFKIHQNFQEENKKADRSIPLEFLPNPSIDISKTISQETIDPTWMDDIIAYLQNGTLPLDKLQPCQI